MSKRNRIVISLGGSLVYTPKGISVKFLADFHAFIKLLLKNSPKRQIFITVGGGTLTDVYIQSIGFNFRDNITYNDKDWLGIHATRLNAYLIKTIFKDISHPYVLKHYEIIRRVEEPVVIAGGWHPGVTTDYCATVICADYKIPSLVNLGKVNNVYTQDPKYFPSAKPIEKITWKNYRRLMGNELTRGLHAPFDPIASQKADELNLKTIILKGDNFENIKNYLDGKKFIGTVIEN